MVKSLSWRADTGCFCFVNLFFFFLEGVKPFKNQIMLRILLVSFKSQNQWVINSIFLKKKLYLFPSIPK